MAALHKKLSSSEKIKATQPKEVERISRFIAHV
jgi:hypothetical protein